MYRLGQVSRSSVLLKTIGHDGLELHVKENQTEPNAGGVALTLDWVSPYCWDVWRVYVFDSSIYRARGSS